MTLTEEKVSKIYMQDSFVGIHSTVGHAPLTPLYDLTRYPLSVKT